MAEEPAANSPVVPADGTSTASAPATMPSAKEEVSADTAARLEAAQQAAALKRLAALRQARLFRGLEWAMIPLVLLLGFFLASFVARNSDFWMHLASGRLLAQHQYTFGHDPFLFGTEGRYWVNHSWLYDWLTYQVWKLDETGAALVILKAILITLLAGFMLLASWPEPHVRIAPGSKANPAGWLAAILVGAALMASAPRFFLQPTVVSFLFVAVTFWLLKRSAVQPASWRVPAALAVLFALWANLDAWFILGPALVALFLIGELLQQVLPGEPPVGGTARLKWLAATLLISTLACLANPHTIRVFALPPELYAPQLAQSFQSDDSFRAQFASPFDPLYYKRVSFGNSYSGWCYYGLLLTGLLAFGINFRHIRWSLVFTWVSLAAISAWSARTIPFFAVVAAPIAVWNFHSFFAHRRERLETEPTSAESPPQPHSEGGISVTPEAVLSFLGLMGRLLTLALGVAVAVFAWPGWLTPESPRQDRRVAWRIEPEESYKQAAEQIQRWREEGRLPEGARGFQAHPDLVNYCTWYAPKEKGFFDYRYVFSGDRSEDFIDVRHAIRDLMVEHKEDGDAALADIFRRHGIRYLMFTNPDPLVRLNLVQHAYINPDQWSIWYLNGWTIIVGWNDAQNRAAPAGAPAEFSALRVDFVRRAFGPQADLVPPPTRGRIATDIDPAILTRTSVDNFLSAPPIAPWESDESNLYLLLYDVAARVGTVRLIIINDFAQKAAEVAIQATPEWRAVPPTLPYQARVVGSNWNFARAQVWYKADAVPAFPLLAARAARKTIGAHSDDPVSYFNLARAFDGFAVGSQIHPYERIVALQQGLARVSPEQQRQFVQHIKAAYQQLYQMYLSSNQFDVGVECFQKSIELFKQFPPANQTPEELEQGLKMLQQQAQRFEKELNARSDQLELSARNQPANSRFEIAKRFGLTKEALRVLEEEAKAERLDPAYAIRLAQTYLELGQVEQAWDTLEQIEDKFGTAHFKPADQTFYRRIRMTVAAARGDFSVASKEMDRLLAELEEVGKPDDLRGMAVSALAAGHLFDVMYPNPFVRFHIFRIAGAALLPVGSYYTQLAMDYSLRAMLALEWGDNETARKYFALAIQLKMDFEGRREAQRYLELLEKQLPPQAKQ